jgi:hypothetical protein
VAAVAAAGPLTMVAALRLSGPEIKRPGLCRGIVTLATTPPLRYFILVTGSGCGPSAKAGALSAKRVVLARRRRPEIGDAHPPPIQKMSARPDQVINAPSVTASAAERGCVLEREPAARSCSGRSPVRVRSPPDRSSSTQHPRERNQAGPHH